MKLDDMILVSIDDHVIEPPDLFENHMPDEVSRPGPEVRATPERRRPVGVPGRGHGHRGARRHRLVAPRRVELRPGRSRRDAARLLRHPRAHPRHERERRARVVELRHRGRLRGSVARRQARSRTSPRSPCPRTTTGRSTSWPGRTRGASCPLCVLPLWDTEACVRELDRIAAKGCTAITFPETPYANGLPELLRRPLGFRVRGV